jgi:HTH-type transcriptional regulator/antitoxin HipB
MNTQHLKDIGVRVRAARHARCWSQRDLAEASALNQKQISLLERGTLDIRVSTFLRLLDALELPASELLDDVRH